MTTESTQEITLDAYFVAGTPSAAEYGYLDGERPHCCNCGRTLKHCYVSTDGRIYGGDCLATLTGHPDTRSEYRRMEKELANGRRYSAGREFIAIQIERGPSFYGGAASRIAVYALRASGGHYTGQWAIGWNPRTSERYCDHLEAIARALAANHNLEVTLWVDGQKVN